MITTLKYCVDMVNLIDNVKEVSAQLKKLVPEQTRVGQAVGQWGTGTQWGTGAQWSGGPTVVQPTQSTTLKPKGPKSDDGEAG